MSGLVNNRLRDEVARMFVCQIPRVVQGFLSNLSDQLGGPQVRHVHLTVTALLLVGQSKLKTMADAVHRIVRHLHLVA